MRFAGKTAIVTGAGSGIGLATTRRLATEGATVIMADVRDADDEAAGIIESGNTVRFVLADVSQESQVRALVDELVSSHGRVDILVNNAGIAFARTVPDTTLEEWDRLVNVNLKGVFLCSRAVIPIMQQQGGGVIVNVASEQGLVGASENAAYTATKGGVIQLAKSMAIDHGQDGIRVNCVCPGPVKTPLFRRVRGERRGPGSRAPQLRGGHHPETAGASRGNRKCDCLPGIRRILLYDRIRRRR